MACTMQKHADFYRIKKLPPDMYAKTPNTLFNRLNAKEKNVCQDSNEALISKGLRRDR